MSQYRFSEENVNAVCLSKTQSHDGFAGCWLLECSGCLCVLWLMDEFIQNYLVKCHMKYQDI